MSNMRAKLGQSSAISSVRAGTAGSVAVEIVSKIEVLRVELLEWWVTEPMQGKRIVRQQWCGCKQPQEF